MNDQGTYEEVFIQINILIKGLANTNVEGDLKVEHQNLDLKLGLLNLAGKKIFRIYFKQLAKLSTTPAKV